MKFHGLLKDVQMSFETRKAVISLDTDARPEDIEKYNGKQLDITLVRHSRHRSLDANAMLWGCLGDMSAVLNRDSWSIYLDELRQHGKYSFVLIIPEAYDDLVKHWRETRIVGERTITDDTGTHKMLDVCCFYGSSTYTAQEFSTLLNGVIADMHDLGLTPPPTEEMEKAIERWEKTHGRKKDN